MRNEGRNLPVKWWRKPTCLICLHPGVRSLAPAGPTNPKRNFRMYLTSSRSVAWTAVALLASTSFAHAGPCLDEIAQAQQSINSTLKQTGAAGPTARQGTGRTHVQPTPRSIAETEAQLGELAPEKIDAVRQAMVRARAADAAGDKAACEAALADAMRALGQ